MDYFQGVVTEFLRANRATFVNSECLIQLEEGHVPAKGSHWYCDAVAANLAESTVYLCEVTYSASLQALVKRLTSWAANWPSLKRSLWRDCCVPEQWSVVPWVFIPKDRESLLRRKFVVQNVKTTSDLMPFPKVTHLEDVVPWKYPSWDRKLEELSDTTTTV